MAYFISIFLLSIGFFKTKKDKIWSYFILVFMLVLSIGNYDNSDYYNYATRYEEQKYLGLEVGWGALCRIANHIGLNFQEFKMILFIIWIIVLFRTVSKYTKNGLLVFSLYFVFPFFLDVVQLRNMIVTVIIMIAFQYLLKPGLKTSFIYLIHIFLATIFHEIAFWYILLLIAKYWRNKVTLLIYSILITVLGCLAVYSGLIEKIVGFITNRQRTLNYFSSKASYGVIIGWGEVILLFLVFLLFYRQYQKQKRKKYVICVPDKMIIDNKYFRRELKIDYDYFAELMYKVNCIQLISCILICYNGTFFRIVRNLLLFNYIFIAQVIWKNGKQTANSFILKFLIALVIMVVCLIGYIENYNETIIAVLERGWF